MIYDYNHYNDPAKGNKHIYAYGEKYQSLQFCGFIHADNVSQARVVLNAHNRAWGDNNILLDFSEEECRQEYRRREEEYKKQQNKERN